MTREEKTDNVIPLKEQHGFALKCYGAGRMADNEKAVLVVFSRRLTDDELRFFHEVCERSAPLMEDE